MTQRLIYTEVAPAGVQALGGAYGRGLPGPPFTLESAPVRRMHPAPRSHPVVEVR
jgi:hypothetical protein